jgi:hypothetical protein
VILGADPRTADTLSWLRLVTIGDGVVHDSVPVRHATGTSLVDADASPNGRWIAVTLSRGLQGTGRVVVLDRVGRVRDSVDIRSARTMWGPDGALVIAVRGKDTYEAWDLLMYRVSDRGRIRDGQDTLVRQLSAPGGDAYRSEWCPRRQ